MAGNCALESFAAAKSALPDKRWPIKTSAETEHTNTKRKSTLGQKSTSQILALESRETDT